MNLKKLIAIFMLINILGCNSQNTTSPTIAKKPDANVLSLEDIVGYAPTKRANVSEAEYAKGIFILNEVNNIINSNEKLMYLDYWNLAIAFSSLKDVEKTEAAFKSAVELNREGTCDYLDYMAKTSKETYDNLKALLPDFISRFYPECLNSVNQQSDFDINAYVLKNDLDEELVKLIHEVSQNDEKYRVEGGKVNWKKQTPLDLRNQKIIDSLYSEYKTYLGISLVGSRYEIAMWRVVQHSNIEMMEKYLAIIQKACQDNELSSNRPLKMLLDRIYSIKDKCQIFGSQVNVPNCDESIRLKVIDEYGIDE